MMQSRTMQLEDNKNKITLRSLFEEVASILPESECCAVHDDKKSTSTISYASAWKCLRQHEAILKDAIEHFRGDKTCSDVVVAYLASNSVDLLFSMLACTSLDLEPAVAALLNTRWTAAEMARSLRSADSRATTIILYGPGFESVANKVVSQLDHRSCCFPIEDLSSPLFQQVRDSTTKASLEKEASILDSNSNYVRRPVSERIKETKMRGSRQDAFIVFTSGTTGGSKGVRLSHRALAIQALAKHSEPCGYSKQTTMLASTVPLFHVGGLSSCLAALFAGGCLVFPSPTNGPSFDPYMVKISMENPSFAVNTLVVVPAMLASLFRKIEEGKIFHKARLILIGGQSAHESMIHNLKQTFPNARLVQTYACTEAASSLTFLHINSSENKIESTTQKTATPEGDCVGSPPSHINIRLFRKTQRAMNILTIPFVPGIIATQGPHLMNGYWQRGNARQQNRNGWYLTNDLGFYDRCGQLHFCGRVKDVIRSGGETIFSQEVERVLLRHPFISECGVFPRKDEVFGEAVACAIVTTQPLELGAVKDWCTKNGLASYKRPRYLFLIDSLPRNSSGKILKLELIKMFGRGRSKL